MDETETEYDMFFILKKGTTVKNAIAALADHSFNPSALALIQVHENGLDLTVHVTDPQTNKQAFGCLFLKPPGLHHFVCNKPFIKFVSLLKIHNALQSATNSAYGGFISVDIVSGNNHLSFSWGEVSLEDGPTEESVPLYDLESEYATFPDVSYDFEAIIASTTLNNTIQQVLQIDPHIWPTTGFVTMTASTVEMELREGVVVSTERNPETHYVSMQWKYWESLQKALCLADKCSLCFDADLPESILFWFKLQELGDLFYLT